MFFEILNPNITQGEKDVSLPESNYDADPTPPIGNIFKKFVLLILHI